MIDAIGQKMKVGDSIVGIHVCRTNQTLVTGKIVEVTDNSALVLIEHQGSTNGYAWSLNSGDTKKFYASHRIIKVA
jgi:predicted secreted protein